MAIIFHARAHAHAWSFSQDSLFRVLARFFSVVCGISARLGAAPVGSWLLSARMRTRGVFRTWRRSVDHHLYLRSSAVVLFLRVVSARACAYVVFFIHVVLLPRSCCVGPLLGLSWASLGPILSPPGLPRASPGPLLGLSWAPPGPLLGSRDLSQLRKGLFCVANYSVVATCTRDWFRIAKYSTKCFSVMRLYKSQ